MFLSHLPARVAVGAALLLLLGFAFIGCGGGSDDDSNRTRAVALVGAAEPKCKTGEVSPLEVERVGGPITMESPARIIACARTAAKGEFVIVGFDTNNGLCVAIDRIDQGKTYDGICRDPRVSWLEFCEGAPGCVLRFTSGEGFTSIAGVLDPKVKRLRVDAGDSGEVEGLAVGELDGRLLRSLDAKEEIGYFLVLLAGCAPLDSVHLEMLGADGATLGRARESGGGSPTCR
jgi:hypothetical protein